MSVGAVIKTLGEVAKDVVVKTGEAGLEKGKQLSEKIKDSSNMEIDELATKAVEGIKEAGDGVLAKLDDIRELTPEQLKEKLEQNLEAAKERINSDSEKTEADDASENTHDGLTDEEKAKAKEETGWSDEILDAIGSWKEYEIYKNAGLVEAEIGGKKCLIRNDIDWNQTDEKGRTNAERVKMGRAPLDKNGELIQLHHIGQHADSPLAELTFEEHRCNGNDTILHDKSIETETHGEGSNWDSERQSYWRNRSDYNDTTEGGEN